MEDNNRLFVPLNSEAFNWFKHGKEWEVRKMQGQYNLKNIRVGRLVELRRGYNTNDSLWGHIKEVKVFNNSTELLKYIDYKKILPTTSTIAEAEEILQNFVSINEKIIAFKISKIRIMKDNTRRYTTTNLRLIDKFHNMVLNRAKTSTIRLGYVFFTNEILKLKFGTNPDLNVKITKLDYSKCLKDINNEDAQKDGFTNLDELKMELLKFYPNIEETTQFTIVHFDLIE